MSGQSAQFEVHPGESVAVHVTKEQREQWQLHKSARFSYCIYVHDATALIMQHTPLDRNTAGLVANYIPELMESAFSPELLIPFFTMAKRDDSGTEFTFYSMPVLPWQGGALYPYRYKNYIWLSELVYDEWCVGESFAVAAQRLLHEDFQLLFRVLYFTQADGRMLPLPAHCITFVLGSETQLRESVTIPASQYKEGELPTEVPVQLQLCQLDGIQITHPNTGTVDTYSTAQNADHYRVWQKAYVDLEKTGPVPIDESHLRMLILPNPHTPAAPKPPSRMPTGVKLVIGPTSTDIELQVAF